MSEKVGWQEAKNDWRTIQYLPSRQLSLQMLEGFNHNFRDRWRWRSFHRTLRYACSWSQTRLPLQEHRLLIPPRASIPALRDTQWISCRSFWNLGTLSNSWLKKQRGRVVDQQRSQCGNLRSPEPHPSSLKCSRTQEDGDNRLQTFQPPLSSQQSNLCSSKLLWTTRMICTWSQGLSRF